MTPRTQHSAETEPKIRRGRLVAQLLTGSWRCQPPSSGLSAEELVSVTDVLLRSDAGGLTWRRIRNSQLLQHSPAAKKFQETYRYNSLRAAVGQHKLKQVIPLLRNSGVDPVLVKGWAIARLYPEPGLRPYCDHDLCVLPEQYAAAQAALRTPEGQGCSVDLHCGFGKFYDRQTEEIFSRSQLVKLDGLDVRVLTPEDHLRFLCTHMLRHGAVRPLWLCDIALAIEEKPEDFDWDRCLGGKQRQADWVACAIGLAHQLFGVEIADTPVVRRAGKLPSWLVPTVLKEWGSPVRSLAVISQRLRNPIWLLRELPRHWPNPIEATVAAEGPFNELPRLPFQIGHVISRTTALLSQMPGLLGVNRN